MEPEGGGGGGGIGAVRRDPRMEARAAARDVVLALAPADDTGVSAGGDGREDVGTAVTVDEEAEEDEELEWYSQGDRKSTRLNSSHSGESRMPSSA